MGEGRSVFRTSLRYESSHTSDFRLVSPSNQPFDGFLPALAPLRSDCAAQASEKKDEWGGQSLSGRKSPTTFFRPKVFTTFRRKARKPRAIRAPKNHAPAMYGRYLSVK